jgi:hypothetical protein
VPPSSGWFCVVEADELGVALVGELAVVAGVGGVADDVGVGVAAGAEVGAGALGAAAVVAGAAAVAVEAAGFVAAAGVPDAPPVCAFASPITEHQAARPKTRNTLLRRMDEP